MRFVKVVAVKQYPGAFPIKQDTYHETYLNADQISSISAWVDDESKKMKKTQIAVNSGKEYTVKEYCEDVVRSINEQLNGTEEPKPGRKVTIE